MGFALKQWDVGECDTGAMGWLTLVPRPLLREYA